MSACWHERGNVDAHFHPSISAGPLTAHDLDDVDFSSDFDVIERVTDADVHAPARPHACVPSPASSAPVLASSQLPDSRSISQRMLRLLQRHRGKKGHAAAALRSPLAAGAIEQSADDAMEDSEEDFAAQMDGISGSSGEDEGEGNWSFSLAGSKKASKSRDPPQKKVRPIRKSAYEDPDIIVVTSSP